MNRFLFLLILFGNILSAYTQPDVIPPEMVAVNSGTFDMGCTPEQSACNNDELPVHTVTVSSFQIGKYEVTQTQWEAVVQDFLPNYYEYGGGPTHPAYNISWYDAATFCNRLSVMEGLTPCYYFDEDYTEVFDSLTDEWIIIEMYWNHDADGYRLPTEAEWEFAARGGLLSMGYEYSGSNNANEVAWHAENFNGGPEPVGTKLSNELGLYDMSGNIGEYCWDWYEPAYFVASPDCNPVGSSYTGVGAAKVNKGGSYGGSPIYSRVAERSTLTPGFRTCADCGLRLAKGAITPDESSIPCDRQADSIALASLFTELTAANGGWDINWNLDQPMDTWFGVTLTTEGCVERLELQNNSIGHYIPLQLLSLPHLDVLDLSNNQFTGCVPGDSTFWCQQLSFADISNNEFLLYDSIDEVCDPVMELTCSIPTETFIGSDLDTLLARPYQLNGFVSPAYHVASCIVPFSVSDQVSYGDCTPDTLFRTYTISDNDGMTISSCLQTVLIAQPGLQHIYGPPNYFLSDGESFPPNTNNLPHPSYTGYPRFNPYYSAPVILDTAMFGLSFTYEDLSFQTLNDQAQFVRRWAIFDDCSPGDSLIFFQNISFFMDCRFSDSLELVNFFHATGGEEWDIPWELDSPMEEWFGVFLNADGCVEVLDLDGNPNPSFTGQGNNLTGELIDFNLPFLKSLRLSINNISGGIPNFSDLLLLEDLNLSSNHLSGSIPNFSNLPLLKKLYIGNNQLSGSIPDFSNLSDLEVFICVFNNIDGSIPDFSNLPELELFSCFSNHISGDIPDFSNLPNLEQFDCTFNDIGGTIPDFSNLPLLELFYCEFNHISGNIPDFSNLPLLKFLRIDINQLDGNIPDFSNLPLLELFHCSFNHLSGNIPNFSNLPNLEQFDCAFNDIGGNIPDFSNIPLLENINCGYNQLNGTIPNFSNLPNLKFLQCDSNHLSGPIPDFSNLPSLLFINAPNNQLSGNIPDFSNLPSLADIIFSNNNLNGSIPDFSNLSSLKYFRCEDNNLEGEMPNLSDNCPQLQRFYYSGNSFTFKNILTYLNENEQIIGNNATHSDDTLSYAPQDSIYTDTFIHAYANAPLAIDLGIDDTVTTNIYQWYKDGQAYTIINGENTLTFNSIQLSDAGTYWVHITNPNAPELTLESYPITLVVCADEITDYTPSLCPGESELINNQLYDEANPMGTETFLAVNGCDSVVNINLQFYPPNITYIDAQICIGQTYIFDGQTLTDAGDYQAIYTDGNGCDSTINLTLDVTPALSSNFEASFCEGTSYSWNDQTYNSPGQYNQFFTTLEGCDSTVTLTLEQFPAPTITGMPATYYEFCEGTAIPTITLEPENGATIDWYASATGTDIILQGSNTFAPGSSGLYYAEARFPATGCTSTERFMIEVIALPTYSIFTDTTSCKATEVGIDTAWLSTISGCDSIVITNTTYVPLPPDFVSNETCIWEEVGQYIDTLASVQGCDSIVLYENLFPPSLITLLPDTLVCIPDQIGLDTLFLENAIGCDSLVVQNWLQAPPLQSQVDTIICSGNSLLFAGQLIDDDGIYYDTLTSTEGCDSLITLALTVQDTLFETVDTSICAGDIYFFGNTQIAIAGEYAQYFVTEEGCDSLTQLNLGVITIDDYMSLGDTAELLNEDLNTTIDLLQNDEIPGDGWWIELISSPTQGSAQLSDEGILNYILTNPDFLGIDSFTYRLCTNTCIDTCLEAGITVQVFEDCITQIEDNLPTGFTPDGDGINDLFDPLGGIQISCIQNPENTELIIMTKWGEILFHPSPYQPWDGRMNGKVLPQGTYYYILSLEAPEKKTFKKPLMLMK